MGKKNTEKVYLVEDHHAVVDAQNFLAHRLIELCVQEDAVLAVEGHLSDTIPLLENHLPEELLKKGTISGGEYAMQKASRRGIDIIRVDEPDLYERNLKTLEEFFRVAEKHKAAIQDLELLLTGFDVSNFTGKLERANLNFHYQLQGASAGFHGETWGLLVYKLLNLSVDWYQWQIAERILAQEKWRDTFAQHLPDHISPEEIFECIDRVTEFYHLNVMRDTVYAESILETLTGFSTIVFALGPFHHQNLSLLLRKRGIQVQIEKIPHAGSEKDLLTYRQQITGR